MTSRARQPVAVAANLALELGLPEDFFFRLVRDDDWSLVIKCQVLAEIAVFRALEYHLREQGLRDLIVELWMERRLVLAQHHQALPPDTLRRLNYLRRLRYTFAHHVRQCNFTFKDYLANPNKRRTYRRLFCTVPKCKLDISKGLQISLPEFLKENPKFALALCIVDVLITAYRLKEAASRRRRQGLYLELARSLLSHTSD